VAAAEVDRGDHACGRGHRRNRRLGGVARKGDLVRDGWNQTQTRGHDHVLFRVDNRTRAALASLCRRQFSAQGIPGTISTKTLSEEFVIIDFSDGEGGRCQTVDIPRGAVLAFKEVHRGNDEKQNHP
jgi:hypothetical protein